MDGFKGGDLWSENETQTRSIYLVMSAFYCVFLKYVGV